MMHNHYDLKLNSSDTEIWLKQISEYHNAHSDTGNNDIITIHFPKTTTISELQPFHLVTIACMIEYLKHKGAEVFLSQDNPEIADYIYNNLGFKHYWKNGCNHVDALQDDNIFNLWRIVDSEKELYAQNVESYLKKNFFSGKDLSFIHVSLIEAFYNVFDHANANGNAFSLIKFDQTTRILHVAISDFGIGIAESIKNNLNDTNIQNDRDALAYSLLDSVTVKSTKHNKGLGLGNIISSGDRATIFSNFGIFKKDPFSSFCEISTFYFPGTLIFFEVDLNNLDNEEILDTFNW